MTKGKSILAGLVVVALVAILLYILWQSLNDDYSTALISGVFALSGVILGFGLNYAKDVLLERKKRAREKSGLLRILYTDLSRNLLVRGMMAPSGPLTGLYTGYHWLRQGLPDQTSKEQRTTAARRLRTLAWEQIRVLLAPHLPGRAFAVLADYYMRLEELKELLLIDDQRRAEMGIEAYHSQFATTVHLVHKRAQEVQTLIEKHVPDAMGEPPFEEKPSNTDESQD
jgi:hypothetical protein